MPTLGSWPFMANVALDGSSSISTESNESAGHKRLWGWFGPSSIGSASPCGTTMKLIPVEATANPSVGSYKYAAVLPVEGGRINVEYRKLARIGLDFSNRPGVYVSFMDNGQFPSSFLLNAQTDPSNWFSTAPLSVGSAYQVAADTWVRVNSVGVDESGIERADITAWLNSSLCVH